MRNLIRRKILPAALAVLMLAATPALAFAVDGEALAPKLEITKTASADTVAPGGEISYTITVSVTGAPDETMLANQFVTDLLPDGLTYVEDSLKWEGTNDLASEAHFGPKALNATLYTQPQNGEKEEFLYTGQSITFTYRAKADAGLAGGKVLENMAALSNNDGPIKWVKVPVTVVAPANDDPADSGAADADTTAKAENALDSSPKCGNTFLLGWLFKLLGIAN